MMIMIMMLLSGIKTTISWNMNFSILVLATNLLFPLDLLHASAPADMSQVDGECP